MGVHEYFDQVIWRERVPTEEEKEEAKRRQKEKEERKKRRRNEYEFDSSDDEEGKEESHSSATEDESDDEDGDQSKETRRTLEGLRLEKANAFEIFKAFADIDRGRNGEITVEEFHSFLGAPITKYSERVFGIIDLDASGKLSFFEFAIGVWNYCTYDVSLITKLAFDIFDIDQLGKLDM